MHHPKDNFTIAMRVGGMDVALDDVVVHQPIDHIGTLALGGAEDQRMPQQITLIDECVSADALALAEVLKRVIGIERLGPDLEFLAVA